MNSVQSDKPLANRDDEAPALIKLFLCSLAAILALASLACVLSVLTEMQQKYYHKLSSEIQLGPKMM